MDMFSAHTLDKKQNRSQSQKKSNIYLWRGKW